MVSLEAQAHAELLIHKVSSVEQSNSAIRRAKQGIFSEASHETKDRYLQSIESSTVNLADDLSSEGSEEDCDSLEKPQAVEQSSLCAELWRQEFLVDSSAHTELDECKLAMYQMLLNSDIKVRNLQFEVFTLQRLYDDAKLTMERYQNKIDSLEQRLAAQKSSASNEESNLPDPFQSADLRMENHLNKLLASRTKAMDENILLKKQLLECCPKCRQVNKGKASTVESNSNQEQCAKTDDKKSKPAAAAAAGPRRTFQKTAFALVQRMGTTRDSSPPSPTTSSSSNSDSSDTSKRSRPSNVDKKECGGQQPTENRVNGLENTGSTPLRHRSTSTVPHHRMRSQSTPPLKKMTLDENRKFLHNPLQTTSAATTRGRSSGGFFHVTRPPRPASVTPNPT